MNTLTSVNQLKKKLIATNCFRDCYELQLYCELIIRNKDCQSSEKEPREGHHWLPHCVSKFLNIENEELVYLVPRSHKQAHYYIAIANKEPKLQRPLIDACVSNVHNYIDKRDQDLITELKKSGWIK